MGGGSWNANTYNNNTQQKINTGRTFGYTQNLHNKSRNQWKPHDDLDPLTVAGPTSPLAGKVVREARDNQTQKTTLPVSIIFDQTGSMGDDARIVQKKLAGIFGLLTRKNYVDDALQVMVGAYGDALTDHVPLQISQFESSNILDDHLDKIFIEGNGGGNGGESQALAWYYLTHHTATDSLEKRNKKGYAFIIADEISHTPTATQIKELTGDGEPLGDITLPGLAKDFKEKWEVFILVINNYSAKSQRSVQFYSNLFGKEHVVVLENSAAVSETISIIVGVNEGSVDVDDVEEDLLAIGADAASIRTAVNATKDLVRKNNAVGEIDITPGRATRL